MKLNRRHRFKTTRFCLLAAGAMLSFQTSAVLAESTGFDANCGQRSFDDMEEFQMEACRTHAGCNMTYKIGNTGCKVVKFFDKIGDAFSRKGGIDNSDVIDASEPEFVETPDSSLWLKGIRETLFGQKQDEMEADYAFSKGTVEYREGKRDSKGKLTGPATILQSTGLKMRGTFVEGSLNGYGQKIYPSGQMDFGQMKDGFLTGRGVRITERDGRIVSIEGNFVDGGPDGVITVSYVDGTSRRDIYAKGKELMRGELALKGQVPVTPIYKSPEQLAAEAEARYQALLSSGSAVELYTLGERLAGRSDQKRAREVYEALSRRFPADPYAATAIAQLTRMDAADREAARMAEAKRQAQIAQQQEAARQAQLAQLRRERERELQRQRDAQEAADRRRREAAAWGQLAGVVGQAIAGNRGGGGGYVPQATRNSSVYQSTSTSQTGASHVMIAYANGCVTTSFKTVDIGSGSTREDQLFHNNCNFNITLHVEKDVSSSSKRFFVWPIEAGQSFSIAYAYFDKGIRKPYGGQVLSFNACRSGRPYSYTTGASGRDVCRQSTSN